MTPARTTPAVVFVTPGAIRPSRREWRSPQGFAAASASAETNETELFQVNDVCALWIGAADERTRVLEAAFEGAGSVC